jgi:chromosome partitioning protein
VATDEDLDRLLDIHKRVVEDGYKRDGALTYRNYAVTTLRGGVGKSTLSFNLAHEVARQRTVLLADLCAQCNFTETLMRDFSPQVTVLDAMQPMLLGPAFGTMPSDITYQVSKHCEPFKGTRGAWLVPGHPEMFAFPSTLYQQLQIANAQSNTKAVRSLLESLKDVLEKQAADVGADGILMDTSPFYSGGTHLAWCAADAVIIPVRVDEHSLASLELTLRQLSDPAKDFQVWNERAGGRPTPKVAAVVMTMVGSKSRQRSTPDLASKMFIDRAITTAKRYPQLFDGDPIERFVLTDDFVSSGRISGAQSIPISMLTVGKFHTVDGKRLQVNQSVIRYQRELAYLASVI